MKNMKYKKVIIKVIPTTLRDDEGNYTIFDSNNKGGAIISDMDPLRAMGKFKEATHLCMAVMTLMEKLETKYKTDNFYVAEFEF